ncbi:uncharacterized protein LOC132722602 [Ruditapes philippinarum]|uniref:uncharacterized protein LOC132722602 n=1 Tax=Ruditapes philippinarum TaxID=129788 RepID=UPI00295C0846|nr:uncharacterized protein LOC132722602 [Ruditapes philippinarum]
MTVKLESPEIVEFNPDDAIDNWLSGSVMGRRMTYRRQEKKGTSESQQSVVIQYDSDTEDVQQISGSQESQISQESHDTDSDQGVTEPATLEEGISVPQEEIHEVTESYMPLERDINILCDKDSDPDIEEECFDFQDELLNFDKLMAFSRE